MTGSLMRAWRGAETTPFLRFAMALRQAPGLFSIQRRMRSRSLSLRASSFWSSWATTAAHSSSMLSVAIPRSVPTRRTTGLLRQVLALGRLDREEQRLLAPVLDADPVARALHWLALLVQNLPIRLVEREAAPDHVETRMNAAQSGRNGR